MILSPDYRNHIIDCLVGNDVAPGVTLYEGHLWGPSGVSGSWGASGDIPSGMAEPGVPIRPLVATVGTPGATSYTYYIVGERPDSSFTAPSWPFVITTGNATLSGSNRNRVTVYHIPGMTRLHICRNGSANSIGSLTAAGTFDDTGQSVTSISPDLAQTADPRTNYSRPVMPWARTSDFPSPFSPSGLTGIERVADAASFLTLLEAPQEECGELRAWAVWTDAVFSANKPILTETGILKYGADALAFTGGGSVESPAAWRRLQFTGLLREGSGIVPSTGKGWSEAGLIALAETFFGGSASLTSVEAALVTFPFGSYSEFSNPSEITTTGYARCALAGHFAAASSGSSTQNATMNFGTPTSGTGGFIAYYQGSTYLGFSDKSVTGFAGFPMTLASGNLTFAI
jgi:hypothetical protein